MAYATQNDISMENHDISTGNAIEVEIPTEAATDSDKSPYLQGNLTGCSVSDTTLLLSDGKWWLPIRLGFAVCGTLSTAPKKSNRVVLDFALPDGKRKKYYCCEFCQQKTGM